MKKVLYILGVVYFLVLFLVLGVLFMPIELLVKLLTFPFDKRQKVMHFISSFWGSLLIWLTPFWRSTIKGLENIDRSKTYVMIGNHQALIDILAVYGIFFHFKWVAKAELFRWPFVGWNLFLCNYIKISRSSVVSQRRMIDNCLAVLSNGSSVMIFPEGSRSADGTLKRFKDGAFYIAKQAKVDILPITLDGTGKGMHSAAHLKVHVLPPIPYETFAEMPESEIASLAFNTIQNELTKMRS